MIEEGRMNHLQSSNRLIFLKVFIILKKLEHGPSHSIILRHVVWGHQWDRRSNSTGGKRTWVRNKDPVIKGGQGLRHFSEPYREVLHPFHSLQELTEMKTEERWIKYYRGNKKEKKRKCYREKDLFLMTLGNIKTANKLKKSFSISKIYPARFRLCLENQNRPAIYLQELSSIASLAFFMDFKWNKTTRVFFPTDI